MAETHNIVILGGSFGGTNAAHYFLRHVLPVLSALPDAPTYTITLVSTTSHLFWTIGAPRAMISAELVPIEKSFIPIAEGFADYPATQFTFLHAEATSLDPTARTISLKPLFTTSSAPHTLHYSTLLLATGASSTNALWSATSGHENTIAAFKTMHAALPAAKSILIVGGGPVGIETAGEMGSAFGGTKKITLLSGSTQLLAGSHRPTLGPAAEKYLHDLHVEVRHNVRVSRSEKAADGQTTVHLDDGHTMAVDVYIDAVGLKPNTSFLPASLLTATGHVQTDPSTLRVKVAGERVYALGACASYSNGRMLDVWDAIPVLMSSMLVDLSRGAAGKEAQYKRKAETLLVPVGRGKGVGVIYGWAAPSLMIWGIKGRTFMFEGLKGERDGVKFKSK